MGELTQPDLVVEERERHGPYAGAAETVRRTGLKPQAVESLIMAGAFDSLTPNRRKALWDAGLGTRPGRNGQRAFPRDANEETPDLADFTAWEKMAGEYRVMGIYPQGTHDGVRQAHAGTPGSCPRPRWSACRRRRRGDQRWRAGPSPGSTPREQDGTVFVTIEDETGDAQVILWPQVFRQSRRQLGSHVLLVRGTVSRRDGTASVIALEVRGNTPPGRHAARPTTGGRQQGRNPCRDAPGG